MSDDHEPAAWRAFDADGSGFVYSLYEEARTVADDMNWSVEPLYRKPILEQDEIERLRLTDAELEAVEWAEEIAGNCEEFDRVATLRGLLERFKCA